MAMRGTGYRPSPDGHPFGGRRYDPSFHGTGLRPDLAFSLRPHGTAPSYTQFRDEPPTPRKDQRQTSSCVPHAHVAGAEILRATEGQTYVELDPFSVYPDICGGVDAGAVPLDCLAAITSTGIAPTSDGTPFGAVFRSQVPAKAQADRPRFRIEYAGRINLTGPNAMTDILSAVMGRLPVSVVVGGGDSEFQAGQLSPDGLLNVPLGDPDHNVLMWGGLRWFPQFNDLGVQIVNSWSYDWAFHGTAFLLLQRYLLRMPGQEMHVMRSSVRDPLGPQPPPVVA